MRQFRHTRGLLVSAAGPIALALLATGCKTDPQSATADQTEYPAVVRIVEVLASPADAQPAFVELRNDSEAAADLNGWGVSFDGRSVGLRPRPIDGSARRSDSDSAIPAHSLALVVDEAVPADVVAELACEAPIQTSREALGGAYATSDNVLASTLELQGRRHCVPVFTVPSLQGELQAAGSLALNNHAEAIDQAAAPFASAPRGVAFERRGINADAFDLSPMGSTPGSRNFYRSDEEFLHADGEARLPLAAMSSSPWRVGNLILDLERQAKQADAAGDSTTAEQLRQQAQAVRDGAIPDNPIVEPFEAMVASAHDTLSGSFYQINEDSVIDSLVAAKERGVLVRLTTDANFAAHEGYTPGFARLTDAGIPLVFDYKKGSTVDRPSLSHNKFLTMDGEWLWTGSFNPIEDEPSRIHADNTLLIRSKKAVSLHQQEFETMFNGKFSTDKRSVGIGGGRVNVDGAEVSFRFSPGMTGGDLKRRAEEMVATGDPAKACDVRLSSGKNAIKKRYRSLDPCGGPYDLLVGEVARATSSVYFVSFSLSLDDMGAVIKERMGAGVDVRGVVDPTVSTRGIVEEMTAAGADVRFTPNSDPECPAYVTPRYTCPSNPNKVWLHHKFVVIDYGTDHPVVITGSHNMSTSAESKNDETLLVIRDRAIAESYFRMFREAYNHPQTMGVNRNTAGLPALAITEVVASADPQGPQYVEIANVGHDSESLAGLELWNRRGAVLTVDSTDMLAPGQRALVAVGDVSALGVRADTPVVSIAADPNRAIVDPTTALVLRSAADGRWIATYDPYTSEQTLPEGVTPGLPGTSAQWNIDASQIDAQMVELLGINTTPTEEIPTWEPKGLYSDWADEHDVNTTSLVLMDATLATWMEGGEPTPGN